MYKSIVEVDHDVDILDVKDTKVCMLFDYASWCNLNGVAQLTDPPAIGGVDSADAQIGTETALQLSATKITDNGIVVGTVANFQS